VQARKALQLPVKNAPKAYSMITLQCNDMRSYDLIIVGSGSAGLSAAETAREAGVKSIALIEAAKRLGGECPNWGCVPTKALLRSTEVISLAHRAGEFGLRIPRVSFRLREIMERRGRIVDALTGDGRIEGVLKKLGVDLLRGKAKFISPDTLAIGKERVSAKRFIIATGSEAVIPPIPGLKESGFLTSNDIVTLKKLPKSIIIIGGGPIGVESAQILSELGVNVTIVEFAPHILPREDDEIASIVTAAFTKRGVKIFTTAQAIDVGSDEDGRHITIEVGSEKKRETLVADAVLVAVGKRPVIADLQLEKVGIELDERGRPKLNEFLQSTSNASVYFAGDAAGQMLFTHVAHEQGTIAATNIGKGNGIQSDLRVVPRGTFCTPEVGSVGITEVEARKSGAKIGIGTAPYAMLGKALVTGESDGLVKIIVDMESGHVLGGHVVGQAAAEIIHEIALAMFANIPYTTIAKMIHAYPTFAEGVGAAAYSVKAIV